MSHLDGRYPAIDLDFDGVIHSYTSPWTCPEEIHDDPVPGAIEWLCQATERVYVNILTARASSLEAEEAIYAWLFKHGMPEEVLHKVRVTNIKSGALVYLDDRGVRFEGVFPPLDDLLALRPWNRRVPT